MEFIRGFANLLNNKKDCALTIGNFDGVHLGHQAVLKQLKTVAVESNLVSTVLIFEPQPIEFFSPDKAPSRLTRLREKLHEFQREGIDRVVCLKFDEDMANKSAGEFVDKILVSGLVVKKLIVGDDFRFAKNREGDFRYLLEAAELHDFVVSKTESFNLGDERISSTLIRKALAEGEMTKATDMLGRPYRISGRVVHGDKRGSSIGFATANIELHRYFSPVEGIFSGRVYGLEKEPLDAVVYVGSRPVYKGDKVVLEVHILDYDQELYGHSLQVEFLEKLRGEGHFDSEEELIAQIKLDIDSARTSLKNYN